MAWGILVRTKKGDIIGVEKKLSIAKSVRKQILDAHPKYKVYIFSTYKAFPPPEDFIPRPKSSHLWCPYCKHIRHFPFNDYLGVGKCEVCNIGERDYYVRLYNGVFTEMMRSLNKKGK
jgi:hypothetical protein